MSNMAHKKVTENQRKFIFVLVTLVLLGAAYYTGVRVERRTQLKLQSAAAKQTEQETKNLLLQQMNQIQKKIDESDNTKSIAN